MLTWGSIPVSAQSLSIHPRAAPSLSIPCLHSQPLLTSPHGSALTVSLLGQKCGSTTDLGPWNTASTLGVEVIWHHSDHCGLYRMLGTAHILGHHQPFSHKSGWSPMAFGWPVPLPQCKLSWVGWSSQA